MSLSTHQVAAALAASLRSHPDLDLVAADNLRDRPYHLDGATIYLNGALPAAATWEAILAALNELSAGTNNTPLGKAQPATVIPISRRTRSAGPSDVDMTTMRLAERVSQQNHKPNLSELHRRSR